MKQQYTTNRSRGAALVEFALILPLLMLFLLGIIEFGMLVLDKQTLEQAAREGTRVAAVGSPIATIKQRITNSSAVLTNQNEMVVTLSYSTDNGITFPYTLADASGGVNNAPSGSLLQARLDLPHHLITGSFFSWLSGLQGNAVMLHTKVVMRRE